jgi:hypothetical protein
MGSVNKPLPANIPGINLSGSELIQHARTLPLIQTRPDKVWNYTSQESKQILQQFQLQPQGNPENSVFVSFFIRNAGPLALPHRSTELRLMQYQEPRSPKSSWDAPVNEAQLLKSNTDQDNYFSASVSASNLPVSPEQKATLTQIDAIIRQRIQAGNYTPYTHPAK